MSRVQKIIEILNTLQGHIPKLNKDQTVGNDFDNVCRDIFGVQNSFEFVADFSALLNQVEEDIARVPNLSDAQRNLYLNQLNPLRNLFSSKTFVVTWKTFANSLGEGPIRNSLLLMDPLLDPERYNLRKLADREAVRSEMDELESAINSSQLPQEVVRLLKFEISKMRLILDNAKSFKETKIWEQYEKLTAQLVAAVAGLDQEERGNFTPSLKRLARRVREGIGLAADIAQLADASSKFPMIGS